MKSRIVRRILVLFLLLCLALFGLGLLGDERRSIFLRHPFSWQGGVTQGHGSFTSLGISNLTFGVFAALFAAGLIGQWLYESRRSPRSSGSREPGPPA